MRRCATLSAWRSCVKSVAPRVDGGRDARGGQNESCRMRVAVIGAGIIGVTTACFLLRKGHEVKLVDPNQPGEGASFGNAGCFNGSSVVPLSMPGSLRHVLTWLRDPLGPLSLP